MGLGPFELRNALIALAKSRGERLMLNAGRGNPNWIALEPREAFFLLGEFAVAEARHVQLKPGFGGLPPRRGLGQRLRDYLESRSDNAGARLLSGGIEYAGAVLNIAADDLAGEWVDGVLGDHYPVPVRMLPAAERLVDAHLAAEVLGGDPAASGFQWFAVEGASAGITYTFQTLVHSGFLHPGDAIAVGIPIFTPYLELPRLPDYRFELVEIAQDPHGDWRYPATEIAKLRDPRVKAFLAVNPSNPTAVAMDAATIAEIAAIVRERSDLIVVTDDVYAPFIEGFQSLAVAAPANTILLYSFSKAWGATGLRLGVVGIRADNAFDARLARGTDPVLNAAGARYRSLSTDPKGLKLIDRMVADSRAIGLNHTAGLSTPQQVQMSLLALEALQDPLRTRDHAVRAIVRARFDALHAGAGIAPPDDPLLTRYYATLDVRALARTRYGQEFAAWLAASFEPIDFVVRLAEERGVVLLDGGGFDAPKMSVRISLANLPDECYAPIGRAIAEQLADYHREWETRGTG